MNADKKRNLEYYSAEDISACDCGGCRNFILQIKEKYPEIAEYFSRINVDILKPFELIWIESDNYKRIDYIGCQYIVFGTCEENYSAELNGVKIFNNTDCHPTTNIDEKHFVLDFGEISLDYLL